MSNQGVSTKVSDHTDSISYNRRKTRTVTIGTIPIGGKQPIRVQSMTTTDTMDTKGTVEQSIRLIEAGCEYIRITAPSIKEAKQLEVIKKELIKKGHNVPLIADIHFTPNAAEWAAKVVEKVRINPGNYADKKRFEQIEYTTIAYQNELDRIRTRFLPLVDICKAHGTVLRIGTNHGSLSDRIMSRYGDTPLGMVESALEFVRICESESYYDIVLSMKSSNPQVMVQAYRLLVQKLDQEELQPYPLHLGVTEAGDGPEGRIKSAVGIGTLLEEGLGDTIRVSLTEEPEDEIPVAKILAHRHKNRPKESFITSPNHQTMLLPTDRYQRRVTNKVANFGGHHFPPVIAIFSSKKNITRASLMNVGYRYEEALDKWHLHDTACDYLYAGDNSISFSLPETLGLIYNYDTWLKHHKDSSTAYPMLMPAQYLQDIEVSNMLNFISVELDDLSATLIEKIKQDSSVVLYASHHTSQVLLEFRAFFLKLKNANTRVPVILNGQYHNTWEEAQLYSATDLGGLFIDGLGDGISLFVQGEHSDQQFNETAFKILQAARMRISRAEYISCPSCGRTLFSLQETTAKIRAKTDHLKGIKIGIMGCIVNGPGEMADADYGYVGSGKEKITLYRGKEVVKRNVPSVLAVEELIELIRKDGNWIDKKLE